MAPAIGTRAFEMKAGEVSEALRSQNGFAFITVTGTQESRLPSLDEVKARVREDVTNTKAIEAAQAEGNHARRAAQDGRLHRGAKAAGLEAKTTELIVRGAALPDVGVSAAVDAAAFALPQGGVSEPIVTETGAVIVKVLEKQSPTRRRAQDRARHREARAPEPAETALLRVLHDQGPRADEHQVEPAGHCAGGGIGLGSAGSAGFRQDLGADSKVFLSLEPRA